MDESACNYNPLATDPPFNINIGTGTDISTDSNFVDNNWVMTDSVEFEPIIQWIVIMKMKIDDGVCDIFEIVGCTDTYACNYNATQLPIQIIHSVYLQQVVTLVPEKQMERNYY